jgi:two-component system sensor histidine kinase PilS (NtrC family)
LQRKDGYYLRSVSREAVRRRLAWFLLLRLCVASLFLGGTIVYQLRVGLQGSPELPFLYWMVSLTYLQSGASAFLLQKTDRLDFLTQTIIAWDLLLATFLIYLTGGSASHFSFLYILIIFSASLFLRRRYILFVAAAAAIFYGSLLDLQYFEYLPILSGLNYPKSLDGIAVLYEIFLHVTAFFLIAVLSSVLVETRFKSEQELKKKAIDLEELESLNREILANINSGLMLVNTSGRIRSFNQAAEEITGFTFDDVYNRDVRVQFPCFDLFNGEQFNLIIRGQTDFQNRDDQPLTIGYTSTQVKDPDQRDLGLLVVFQDLTESIEMDQRMRRADQQAAVGRLASGMAHEIRNPLAAISGSVQLLLEGDDVQGDDRRLMKIVVSEADRLSKLLTDFLSFAKPAKPEIENIDVAELFDQIIDMLEADPRFAGIKLIREYQPESFVLADRKQLSQIILDLTINASEAMNGCGTINIGFGAETSSLYIEDSGPGIATDIVANIFEPFFTTKQTGTGLGLATVQTIVEAHGGYIDVVTGRHGGAKFVVTLSQQRQQGYAVFGSVADRIES